MILRLVEFRGRGGEVTIGLPPEIQAADKVKLMELQREPLQVTG